MRIEIPEFARCCACVPLRFGILVYAYLNLFFVIFLLAIDIWETVVYDSEYTAIETLQLPSLYMYHGVGMFTQKWLILILYGLELVFNILLVIGAHMKRAIFIRAYYYYGVTTCLAAFCSYVVVGIINNPGNWRFEHYVIDFCLVFSGLFVEVYLLLLIRSELKKLEQTHLMCFVNHAAEVYVDPPCNAEGRNPL